LEAGRDWGHAKEYVACMWQLMQLDEPDDYVIATGQFHTVRDFVEAAFKAVGRRLEWRGKGVDEVAVEKGTDLVRVKVNPVFYRPIEATRVVGDAGKLKAKTGWEAKITFEELVADMVLSDLEKIKRELASE